VRPSSKRLKGEVNVTREAFPQAVTQLDESESGSWKCTVNLLQVTVCRQTHVP